MSLKDRLFLAVIPFVASIAIRIVHLMVRTEIVGETSLRDLWQREERVIISFWHDQLLLMVFGYPRDRRAKLLISSSRDGELIARVMSYFGKDTVRGSSSRGGRAAFREMLNMCKDDYDLVLTPDGPRGPRHELKDGVVQLARLSGRPVVPMAFACSRGHRFGSWDRCLLPYPFSRGVYSFGEPVYFDRDEGVERFRERIIEAMRLNQRQAEARLEAYGVSAV